MKRSTSRSSSSARHTTSRPLGSVFTHLVCFVTGILLATGLGFVMPRHGTSFPPGSSSAKASARVALPPWGEIEYTRIDLERPDESFQTNALPVPPATWFFRNYRVQQIEALFREAGVTPEQQRLLADQSRWHVQTNGWMLLPAPEVIRTLAPNARRHIYAVLKKFGENSLHTNPAHFASTEFDDWLAQCGLPADKRQLFESLCYREGGQVLFADFEYFEAQCTRQERQQLARAVSQAPCLYMKLHIRPDTDVDALLRYWGRGGQGRAMKPFLQSLTRVPGGTSLGVTFFFPEFARLRLYTYPDPATDRSAIREDCFWSAMNFSNQEPDERLFDPAFLRQTLNSNYVRVDTNWIFGDVIAVGDAAGQMIHMAVYIADDVVFTKNGIDTLEPWRLMKLCDMMKTYSESGPVQLAGFRRKDLTRL